MSEIISIIIPVYKVEDYIHRCIDSVLIQTYNNIEIILVDDGSPDRCGEICESYAERDKRIKVIHKKNGGLSDARNAGMNIAIGKYITFIDSDDWIVDDYIERLYNLLIIKGADISACNFIRTETEALELSNIQNTIYEFSNIQALENLCGEFYEQLTVSWGKLYKTELFNEIWFPVGKIHEDEFTTYKVLYNADKIVYTTEPLLYYWQRPDSIMGTGFKLNNRLHAIEALQERVSFFEDIIRNDLKDKTIKSLFGMYKSINENIHMFENDKLKKQYIENYEKFKADLRNSNQSMKFKLYYEAYFFSPKLASIIEIINKKMRGTVI